MGDKITLNLDPRTLHGKKARQLRSEGIVPAVVYGPGIEPVSTQAPYNVIEKVLRRAGRHSPVHLNIDGKKKLAMVKDVDMDAVKGRVRHVSFHAVNVKDPVVAEVPIRLTGEGESPAERAGLVVLQSLEEIEIRALPMDLPDALEISLESLHEAGDRLTVGDITLPPNVEFVEHKTGHEEEDEEERSLTDQVIATVYEPSALQAANEASGGDAEDESEVESENGEADEDSEEADDTKESSSEKSDESKKES